MKDKEAKNAIYLKTENIGRGKSIIKTSIIGIVTNIALSAFKAFIGIISNSISIAMDAVNNLSDALSSFITMIGTRLSMKEPDSKHPYGYGRIEFLTAMVIGVLILYAGCISLKESVQKIIFPVKPEYSVPSLVIIAAAVIVKLLLGLYTKKVGEKNDSDALVASGKDALNDVLLSVSTLVAAIIYLLTNVSIEAYVGALISVIILKAGFDTLKDTISSLLGEGIPRELSKNVKETINSFPEVKGVYDLVINDYGKDYLIGSVHIEVPENLTAHYLDGLERKISDKVYEENNVLLNGISVYSVNVNDNYVVEVKDKISALLSDYKDILGMHGFYVNRADQVIVFDVVVSFEAKNKNDLRNEIIGKIKEMYPGYNVYIALDYDYTEH